MSKKYQKVIMYIRVMDTITNRQVNEFQRTIDSKDRVQWINRIVMWAMMNNRYLIISNKVPANA